MTLNVIRLLHVEDDRIQQAWIARQLATMHDYRFETARAASEDEAIRLFIAGSFELVILDFNLTQGNGVNCLSRIRQYDSLVPIIAVSGTATNEIAALLITAGADDYLAKQALDSRILSQSVRNVLTRAQAFQSRFAALRN
ncbi:Transcriptional regulatory protein OmpR [Anatilimnocola aggregata]|uniref:Transcriptional regulatory protein OmpR n=1 Tax=Anatilimnocola aggregata TaxID=2528021 RepID=A0A517YEM7_9BACT|nr:response regulator [Anatilimnocola aggregata]QDU28677.1 Transcriptional regulatory protein OmpR [Anatilimnocola aggregata]